MNKLLIITSLIVFPLTGCNSDGDITDIDLTGTDLTVPDKKIDDNKQYISKSCIDDDSNEPLTENTDIFVSLDSLYFNNITNAISERDDITLTVAHSSASLNTFGIATLPLITFFCTYESFEENQCTYTIDGEDTHTEVSGSKSSNSLSYTIDKLDKTLNEQSLTTVTYEDIHYRNGSMIVTEPSGTTTVNWSRSSDGTEYYSTSDQLGNKVEFIENSDCSGEMSYARYNEALDVIDITLDSNWSTLGQPVFAYNRCSYDSELMGLKCSSGAL